MSEPLLRIEGLMFSFGRTPVLKDLNLEIHAGENCLLWGLNGSGKTTLGKIIAGLLRPDAGRVNINTRENSTPAGMVLAEPDAVGRYGLRRRPRRTRERRRPSFPPVSGTVGGRRGSRDGRRTIDTRRTVRIYGRRASRTVVRRAKSGNNVRAFSAGTFRAPALSRPLRQVVRFARRRRRRRTNRYVS